MIYVLYHLTIMILTNSKNKKKVYKRLHDFHDQYTILFCLKPEKTALGKVQSQIW